MEIHVKSPNFGMNHVWKIIYASKDLRIWWSIHVNWISPRRWMPWPRKSKPWQGHPRAIVAWRPSRETINLPASSKGCCMNPQRWCQAPLTIHSAPLGRYRYKNFINIHYLASKCHVFSLFARSLHDAIPYGPPDQTTASTPCQQRSSVNVSTSPSCDPNLLTNHPPESMARTTRPW